MFKLQSSERIRLWRKFRYDLDSMPLTKAIEATNHFWQHCPFVPYNLEIADPKSWPNPWELILENRYCDVAKVLAIVYTLYLTKHGEDLDPEIRAYLDTNSRYTYHIAYLCQGKYVLNLIEGEVVNKAHITKNFKLKYCYTAGDLQLEQYK